MTKVNIFSALGLGGRAGAVLADGVSEATGQLPGARLGLTVPAAGSRRKRLWELDAGAHCPVVGVCLTVADLRRLAARHWPEEVYDSDYSLHAAVVSASRSRNPVAEALQKELESRFRLIVRRASQARDEGMLAAWWSAQAAGTELAGGLWATLTHPRCDAALAQRVLGEVHMLQHQVGARARVEARRLESALAERSGLVTELSQAQARLQRLSSEAAARIQALEGELLRARAGQIGRDSLLAQRDEELQALQASSGLREQELLRRQCDRLARRAEELADELARVRAEREREGGRTPSPPWQDAVRISPQPPTFEAAPSPPCQLADRAVLCVGGRPASVPLYRLAVQRAGARFLHHDGGDGHKVARLEETLRAADLVICQTGCISHGAYWRVKDHCKRTGTPCLFVETPSRSALERALAEAASRLEWAASAPTP